MTTGTLKTVDQYVGRCRTMLQDVVNSPYRYSDADLVEALNECLLEIRRIRPDLLASYFGKDLPRFEMSGQTLPTDEVPLDEQYRIGIVYYICGQAQLRDEENTQDGRATIFLNKFVALLTDARA